MKVHLNQIPAEGKHFEGEEPNSILDLQHPEFVRPTSPVSYSLDVGLSDGGLFATGSVAVDLELQCVTCLESFPHRIEIHDFACQVELTSGEMVDLTPLVREDILLALPPHPHCDWNGQKECTPASYPQGAESETLPGPSEIWGPLDQLKIKETN